MKFNSFEHYKQYEVKANNIENFLKKYTKHDKHEGRGNEYVQYRIKSYYEEFNKYGFCFITHHDSVTGEVVSYYGNN